MTFVTSDIHSNTWQRWIILAVLFLARTAMGFQFQAVGALSSLVIADLGIDYGKLGLLIGLYLLPGVVIAYPGGLLGRHFGDKRTVIVGLALMIAGGLLTMSSNDYAGILAGRLISGVGAVLLNVLLTKMTTDWFIGREIGTALALLVSSWPIGIGIALVTLPWIAVHGSIGMAFGSTAAAAAVVLIAIAILYRVPPPRCMARCHQAESDERACRCASSAWCRWRDSYGCSSMSATSLSSASVPLCWSHAVCLRATPVF